MFCMFEINMKNNSNLLFVGDPYCSNPKDYMVATRGGVNTLCGDLKTDVNDNWVVTLWEENFALKEGSVDFSDFYPHKSLNPLFIDSSVLAICRSGFVPEMQRFVNRKDPMIFDDLEFKTKRNNIGWATRLPVDGEIKVSKFFPHVFLVYPDSLDFKQAYKLSRLP